MATLNVVAGFSYSDTGSIIGIPQGSYSPTVTGAAGDSSVSASTVAAALALAGITNPTKLAIKNTGDTNALLVSFDDGSTFPVSIAPGETNVLSLVNTGLVIKYKSAADTTTFSYALAA